MIFINRPLQRWHCSVWDETLWDVYHNQEEWNKHESLVFEKARNGKLVICNGKLIIMYLSISK